MLPSSRHHKNLIAGLPGYEAPGDLPSNAAFGVEQEALPVFHKLAVKSAVMYGLGKSKEEIHGCFEERHEGRSCERVTGHGAGVGGRVNREAHWKKRVKS